MVEEFRAAGETHFNNEEGIKDNDFPAYVRWLQNGSQGIGLENGLVPWSAFWLMEPDSRSIIGVSSVRHRLSPFLEQRGGHVGYAIRPSRRRQGYGKLILSLTLKEVKQLGLRHILLICHSNNVGSVRIIEASGGKFQDEIVVEGESPLSRYWIDLP